MFAVTLVLAIRLFSPAVRAVEPEWQSVEQGQGQDFVTAFSHQQQSLFYGRSDLEVSFSIIRQLALANRQPETLALTTTADYDFVSSPSVVEFEGQEFLYYMVSARFWGTQAQWLRAPVANLKAAEPVVLPGNYGAYSIARVVALQDGSLGMVYRAGRSQLFFSRSQDGITFGEPVQFAVGTMPASASFADGTVLVSYQNGPSITEMGGRLQVSSDQGHSWSDMASLPQQGDIHDLSPVKRLDGNLDIYYSAKGENQRLGLYRTCVTPELTFGSVEELLSSEQVHAAKSTVHHTSQGLLLTFIQQTDDLQEGNLSLMWLEREAPTCPESVAVAE
ncbi:sialidase family protein [Alkalimonas sp.]|uniref:sialidase family protein n=1 Tax=Alkalimonas sp. TaxID=1872453 RepID=UPI00263B6D40|nr:sialidase family protein [Alkalimonas sp.]MCC5825193.1 exo-alpha-sialidase [Alkalimonas sp.]